MRIRTVKPGFWENEELATVSAEAALLAIGLMNYADDEGYFKANPKLIEAAIFPLRELSTNIRRMIDELSEIGFLRVFRGVDGKDYGQIVNFSKHQRVDRAKESEIKKLEKFDEGSTKDRRRVSVGREGKGKDSAEQDTAPKAVIELPTNKGGEFYQVLETDISQWIEDYPNVAVRQELGKMRSWLDANQPRRKTKGGMRRFIVGWLSRQQDKPGSGPAGVTPTSIEDLAR